MINPTIFQFFHWYFPTEGNLWRHGSDQAAHLSELGVSHVWLPPAFKSAYGGTEPGYAVYDLFDLGEFDQKGSIRTKHGTKDEYLTCIRALQGKRIQVLADIVLNHKDGADEEETIPVQQVDPNNRNEKIGEELEINGWTKYNFPNRKGAYSTYVWDWHSFTGISGPGGEIFRLLNEHAHGEWEEMIEDENGNFDYLMGADIEFRNPNVREELKYWGRWYFDFAGVDGVRLDALKHINFNFFNEWLDHIKDHIKKDFLCIGEYWRNDVEPLLKYIAATGGRIQLFDTPLHFNFHEASLESNDYDMRTIFNNTLTQHHPSLSITFVDNHDTQPLQSLQSTVEFWFKPHANALILLRQEGIPCIFYPSIYEAKYSDTKDGNEINIELHKVAALDIMMKVRNKLAYGQQRDYFDHQNTIGWTRSGIDEKKGSGCAVLLTNGTAGDKSMEVGKQFANKIFVDATGNRPERIKIDKNGFGKFLVNDRSVSVWVLATIAKTVRNRSA